MNKKNRREREGFRRSVRFFEISAWWDDHLASEHDSVVCHSVSLFDGRAWNFIFGADAGEGVACDDGVDEGGAVRSGWGGRGARGG